MKVILYMAMTANGMIAKANDDTSWVSEDEWNSYSSAVRDAGCFIVGKRTYEILTKQPEFSELKDVRLIIVTHEDFETLAPNHIVAHSPQEAIELAKDYKEVIVAGGGKLNASFMEEQLIDEIYLDIEPKIIGDGIRLFEGLSTEFDLELMSQKMISSNEIQLHYKIKKNN